MKHLIERFMHYYSAVFMWWCPPWKRHVRAHPTGWFIYIVTCYITSFIARRWMVKKMQQTRIDNDIIGWTHTDGFIFDGESDCIAHRIRNCVDCLIYPPTADEQSFLDDYEVQSHIRGE